MTLTGALDDLWRRLAVLLDGWQLPAGLTGDRGQEGLTEAHAGVYPTVGPLGGLLGGEGVPEFVDAGDPGGGGEADDSGETSAAAEPVQEAEAAGETLIEGNQPIDEPAPIDDPAPINEPAPVEAPTPFEQAAAVVFASPFAAAPAQTEYGGLTAAQLPGSIVDPNTGEIYGQAALTYGVVQEVPDDPSQLYSPSEGWGAGEWYTSYEQYLAIFAEHGGQGTGLNTGNANLYANSGGAALYASGGASAPPVPSSSGSGGSEYSPAQHTAAGPLYGTYTPQIGSVGIIISTPS